MIGPALFYGIESLNLRSMGLHGELLVTNQHGLA